MIIFKVKHDIPKCHYAFFLPEMKPSEIQVNGLGRPLLLPLKTFSFTSKYVREASFFFFLLKHQVVIGASEVLNF